MIFDNNIADYDYSSGSLHYYWNPESKLLAYRLNLTCEREWGESGQKALADVLKSKGYKLVKQGVDSSDSSILAAVLAKVDFNVAVLSRDEGNERAVICFNDPKLKESVLSGIVEKSKDNTAVATGDEIAEDSVVAVVAEDMP